MRAKRKLGEFCLIKGSEFSTLLLSTSLTVGELTIELPGLLGDNLAEFRAAVDFHVYLGIEQLLENKELFSEIVALNELGWKLGVCNTVQRLG